MSPEGPGHPSSAPIAHSGVKGYQTLASRHQSIVVILANDAILHDDQMYLHGRSDCRGPFVLGLYRLTCVGDPKRFCGR